MAHKYEWKITFRNDLKGFHKTVTLKAPGHLRAIAIGYETLIRQGYKSEDLEVIKLERGREVGS